MMKKNKLFFIPLLLLCTFAFAQIGIKTTNPKGVYHIDPKGDTNVSNTNQKVSDDFVVKQNGTVGIGTISPNSFSGVEISSDKGLRLPQLSDIERDTLNAEAGFMFFNTTSKCINIRTNTSWIEQCGCIPVSGPLNIYVVPDHNPLRFGEKYTLMVDGVVNATELPIWKVYTDLGLGIYTEGAGFDFPDLYIDEDGPTEVQVTVKGCDNSTYTETKQFTHCKPMTGELSLSPESTDLNVNTMYTFKALGMNGASLYEWYINGVLKESSSSNTYSFTTSAIPGSITVKVVAKDPCNISKELTKEYKLSSCTPVSGTLVISPNTSQLLANTEYTFSVSGALNATSYDWYINNEIVPRFTTTGTSMPSFITDDSTGILKIRVVARGCGTARVEATREYDICRPISGVLSLTPASNVDLTQNTSYTFIASGVNDASSYTWYINDIEYQTTTTNTLDYTRSTTGPLKIKVVAKGCNSDTKDIERTYNVVSACSPVKGNISITPNNTTSLRREQQQTFSVIGIDNINDVSGYKWYVNNVLTSENPTMTYTPANLNNLSIKVEVFGCNGSLLTTTATYTVCAPLSGTLVISPKSVQVNAGDNQRFTASGVTGASSYRWQVINSSNAVVTTLNTSSTTFDYRFTSQGTFTVRVTAIGGCGDQKVASTNVNGVNTNIVCKRVGRFLVPETNCKEYIYCVWNGGGFNRYQYVCPTNSKFNWQQNGGGGQCSATIVSCPF